jgi:hypothetical protein
LRSSSAFDKQCILSFGIDADHTDTRVDVFAKPYTEEESDTLYIPALAPTLKSSAWAVDENNGTRRPARLLFSFEVPCKYSIVNDYSEDNETCFTKTIISLWVVPQVIHTIFQIIYYNY